MKIYTVITDVDTFFVTENAKKALEKAKEVGDKKTPVWIIEDHVNTFPHVEVIYQNIEAFQEEYKLY